MNKFNLIAYACMITWGKVTGFSQLLIEPRPFICWSFSVITLRASCRGLVIEGGPNGLEFLLGCLWTWKEVLLELIFGRKSRKPELL